MLSGTLSGFLIISYEFGLCDGFANSVVFGRDGFDGVVGADVRGGVRI